jgi:tetratricopeptide (TPR) repeat protein
VGSGKAKFKQVRHLVIGAGAFCLLAGCATTGPKAAQAKAAPTQPLDTLTVATLPPERDPLAQLMEGDFALARTDLKAAAAAYGRAAPLSGDPKVAERAAQLAVAVHDPDGAARAIARWQALGATPAQLAEIRAELALDRGQGDEARQQLEVLVTHGGADAWRTFGRVLVSARDQAQAARLLETIATPQRLPNDSEAWLAMSELGDRLGRHGYAQAISDAAVARFHDGRSYAWAGQLKFKAGDKVGAKAYFAKALQRSPKDAQLRLAYATLLGQSGDEPGALKLLQGGPQTAETFAIRTALAAHANNKAELGRIYAQIKAAPDQVQADSAFLAGQLAELLGQNDEALDWYDQVADGDEHAFDASVRTAVILQSEGKSAEAHETAAQLQMDFADQPEQLRKAIVIDAELYMREKHYAQAADAYGRALRVTPNDADLTYARGLAYAEAGNNDAAIADLRQVLALKPGDADASNALGYTLADINRDLPEAEKLIQAARSAHPDDPAIADSWGWLQFRLGHLDTAEQSLRTAWASRQDADVGAHLAQVLWARGQKDEARRLIDQVRKLDPDSVAVLDAEKRLTP